MDNFRGFVFSPALDFGYQNPTSRADFLSACNSWKGEFEVWTGKYSCAVSLPRYSDSKRSLAVPGMRKNHFDVFGFNQKKVVPLGANSSVFPDSEWLRHLYLKFVNSKPVLVPWNESVVLRGYPHISNEENSMRVSFHNVESEYLNGCFKPIASSYLKDRKIVPSIAAWPSEVPPHVVGNFLKSMDSYIGESFDLAKSDIYPDELSMRNRIVWGNFFDVLFRDGGSTDVFITYLAREIADILSLADKNLTAAVLIAESKISQIGFTRSIGEEVIWYISRKNSMREDNLLLEIRENYGYSFETINEFEQKEIFRDKTQNLVQVDFLHGWLGYIWLQLVDDLRSRKLGKQCRICGRLLTSTHGRKMYCSKAEDLECYRKRNAAEKRKSRLLGTERN